MQRENEDRNSKVPYKTVKEAPGTRIAHVGVSRASSGGFGISVLSGKETRLRCTRGFLLR
jgi:hypothetical protein